MKTHIISDNLLIALDIGTTKICVLVAQQLADNSLEIIGIGKTEAHGVSRGVIVDVAQAVHAIKLAIKEAELMSGCKIPAVQVGISGGHIQSLNSQGMIAIKHGSIKSSDVTAVLSAAKAVVIPEGQQILHVLPQYFTIDAQQRVMDPIGMFGVRLEAQVHIITGSVASVATIINCCHLAGVRVTDIVLEPLASALSVLSTDERELGVGMLDIGGGTSDFIIYQQGSIRHTKVFSIAGNHVTHDIALCLRTTLKGAEKIKKEFGSTEDANVDFSHAFEVEMVHGDELKRISMIELMSVINPRIEELFAMLKREIDSSNLKHMMPSGLVLTGGGALLKGIPVTASNILKIPVRVGNPNVLAIYKDSLSSPIYSTGYGLLLYMLKKNKDIGMDNLTGPLVNRILWRMKSWISDFF